MDQEQALKHLQAALQTQTISYPDRSRINFKEYEKFIEFIKNAYPHLHQKASLEMIQGYSLLFHLKGSTNLKPIALMGHYDVVPVKEEGWTQNPFGGEVIDGHVYGRGSLDMKGHVIAFLEALEALLEAGMIFKRDVYILLGHNEETGSNVEDSGAKNTMELLKSRGIHFECVIDEGGAFIEGKALGVPGLVAVIGVAEKGYLDVELTATQNGGHASMPPHRSALYEVFEAAMKMEQDKFKADYNAATLGMFKALVPFMKQPFKFLFGNPKLFKPIILAAMVKNPSTAATVRTTSVMTMAEGSKAPNVLAQKAQVNLNCRIVPGDSVQATLDRIQQRVGNKISVTGHHGTEPTDVSPSDSRSFNLIRRAIQKVYPEFTAVAPYLMVAATDSRVYHGMSEGVYRVQPFKSMLKDLGTIHADDERLELDSFYKGIEFFSELLKTLTE